MVMDIAIQLGKLGPKESYKAGPTLILLFRYVGLKLKISTTFTEKGARLHPQRGVGQFTKPGPSGLLSYQIIMPLVTAMPAGPFAWSSKHGSRFNSFLSPPAPKIVDNSTNTEKSIAFQFKPKQNI